MGWVYYNEIDPYCADWLEALMRVGLIPAGDVDLRSIKDVAPDDVRPYDTCHFFAGLGGWALALRLVGWTDDRPVWTGSCPCQPFSIAGAQRGTADERHLWPDFFRLIRECRPATVLGEQVDGKAGYEWLAGVQADLEGAAYAVGRASLPAAGVGAPHIRHRLFFVADRDGARLAQRGGERGDDGAQRPAAQRGGPWGYRWLRCAFDGKRRRVKPGVRLLAHGVPARVGKLRALGNAIVPQVAAAFVTSYLES